MTPSADALKARAAHAGCLKVSEGNTLFGCIVHYFDPQLRELGYVLWPGERLQRTHLFQTPRVWHESNLERLEWRPVNP